MKAKEIAELSISDLQEKLEMETENLIKMKLNHAVATMENPMQIRSKRRTLARLKTELRKREISQNKAS